MPTTYRFYYIILVFGLSLTISCKSKQVIHRTQYEGSEQMESIISKFSDLLHVEKDSLSNYSLYKSIEDWSQIKDSLNVESIGFNTLFIQYLYYFNYDLQIPETYNELYNWNNTYLYKDPSFLDQGDLVFYKEKHRANKLTGFYLKNNYFVSALPSGDLEYYHLADTLSSIQLLSNAKLLIDVPKQ